MRLAAADLRTLLARRQWADRWFRATAITALGFALLTLGLLLWNAFADGLSRLSWQFLTSFPSRAPERAGILAALAGTAYLMAMTAAIAIPIGVGSAVYLEEYTRRSWFSRLIEVNIANLAGVPSILYGLLGLELFVRTLGLGRSLLAGALTMALLVLPIVIMASREAIKAVPSSIREASYALGASRWQTVWHHVLPMAFPGILTGAILAFSRAIGEAAPLITLGALTYIAFLPQNPMDEFTVLPIQIFNWVSRPQKGFLNCAAGGIVVLLAVLLVLNATAVILRQRSQRRVTL